MNLNQVSDFLLFSMLINYAILTVWFLVFMFAYQWLYRLHGKWFSLSNSQFDAIHYGSMAVYKIGVMLFNLTPWLVLKFFLH